MEAVVGLFAKPETAERAADELIATGIPSEHISVLTRGADAGQIKSLPTDDAEQPGVGRAIGTVVGGAAGAAAGVQLATVAATLFIPAVGPVIATGLIAGALFGIGAGGAIGKAVEQTLSEGLPKDEVFIYEDALRQGRTVLVALAETSVQADAARAALAGAGAETVDAARHAWWIGLRDSEAVRYADTGEDFVRDEATYRLGFEAALSPRTRGKTYDQSVGWLRERFPDVYAHTAFRRGFESGQTYYARLQDWMDAA
jgi:hypothetical protein